METTSSSPPIGGRNFTGRSLQCWRAYPRRSQPRLLSSSSLLPSVASSKAINARQAKEIADGLLDVGQEVKLTLRRELAGADGHQRQDWAPKEFLSQMRPNLHGR